MKTVFALLLVLLAACTPTATTADNTPQYEQVNCPGNTSAISITSDRGQMYALCATHGSYGAPYDPEYVIRIPSPRT